MQYLALGWARLSRLFRNWMKTVYHHKEELEPITTMEIYFQNFQNFWKFHVGQKKFPKIFRRNLTFVLLSSTFELSDYYFVQNFTNFQHYRRKRLNLKFHQIRFLILLASFLRFSIPKCILSRTWGESWGSKLMYERNKKSVFEF